MRRMAVFLARMLRTLRLRLAVTIIGSICGVRPTATASPKVTAPLQSAAAQKIDQACALLPLKKVDSL